jgi:hypothetical protein
MKNLRKKGMPADCGRAWSATKFFDALKLSQGAQIRVHKRNAPVRIG